MLSETPICPSPRQSNISQTLPLKQFQCSFDGRFLFTFCFCLSLRTLKCVLGTICRTILSRLTMVLSRPFKGDRLELPLKGDRLALPLKGDHLALPLKEDRLALPLKEDQLAVPLKGDRLALPLKGDHLSLPLKEDRLALPLCTQPLPLSLLQSSPSRSQCSVTACV